MRFVLFFSLFSLLACAADDPPPDSLDDDADVPGGPASDECLIQAVHTNVLGQSANWGILTDRDGFVRAWFQEYARGVELDRESTTFEGAGTRFYGLAVQYDGEGRVTVVTRVIDEDGEVLAPDGSWDLAGELWSEERWTYRPDGGVDTHVYETGPARDDIPARFSESRWIEDGVELVREERTLNDAVRVRWTELRPDGVIRENMDDDGDGTVDRVAERTREAGRITEVVRDAAGEVSWSQTTMLDDGGLPVSRSRDSDGNGVDDYSVAWQRSDPEAVTAQVARMSAGETAVYESVDVELTWPEEHVRSEGAEADYFDDGELDWVTLTKTAWGEPIFVGYQDDGFTAVFFNDELRTSCPDVEPRIAGPRFRLHCAPTNHYESCELEASATEPTDVAY